MQNWNVPYVSATTSSPYKQSVSSDNWVNLIVKSDPVYNRRICSCWPIIMRVLLRVILWKVCIVFKALGSFLGTWSKDQNWALWKLAIQKITLLQLQLKDRNLHCSEILFLIFDTYFCLVTRKLMVWSLAWKPVGFE